MNAQILDRFRAVAEKIAAEVVFAEPGKDDGLLPINSLVLELEDVGTSDSLPLEIANGVRAGRSLIDGIFGGNGLFREHDIAELGRWITWLQNALESAGIGTPPAAFQPGEPIEASLRTQAAPPEPRKELKNEALHLNLAQDAELMAEFVQESGEHLQNIEQGVLVLEENPQDPDTLNSIFRAFHTFKGGAGFLNLIPIHDLAHDLESLLDQARQKQILLTPDYIDLILDGRDLLKKFIDEIAARLGSGASEPVQIPTSVLREDIRQKLDRRAGETPQKRVASNPIADPAAMALEANSSRAAANGSAIKVDTQKLDGLIDAVGELVIAQSLVVQNPALKAVENVQLTRNLSELARITKDLQRTAMSLRMVPIRATFQKMNRLVRDVTSRLGKKIELLTDGEDTELDRGIVEELNDPLIHMVRNSLDHGIEPPEERVAAGKSEQGTVSLRAYHQGGSIVIEIKDDGRGLNRSAILAKAREKGLVGESEDLPDDEIFRLIFAPGFSTAAKVTDLSGRGVGMDVVRRNIEKLRGKIEIQSKAGEGSTFSIYLPLTLAIIDGLLVGIGSERYILPTLTVSESFRLTRDAVKTVQGRGEMINVRGRLRPLLRLDEHLGIPGDTTQDKADSIVVVVQSTNEARCVLVDRLLGKQEVVIKSLGDSFSSNRYVAGAAILGDGRVGLILDSEALVELQASRARGRGFGEGTTAALAFAK